MSIRARINKLEKNEKRRKSSYPYVVDQREDETLEQAFERVFVGLSVSRPLKFILVPAQLTEAEWVAKYSP